MSTKPLFLPLPMRFRSSLFRRRRFAAAPSDLTKRGDDASRGRKRGERRFHTYKERARAFCRSSLFFCRSCRRNLTQPKSQMNIEDVFHPSSSRHIPGNHVIRGYRDHRPPQNGFRGARFRRIITKRCFGPQQGQNLRPFLRGDDRFRR